MVGDRVVESEAEKRAIFSSIISNKIDLVEKKVFTYSFCDKTRF
jgi:hypothetical protein